MYALICVLVFVAGYVINMTYVSVFYHRAFTHNAIRLSPWLRRFVIRSSSWVTGIDLKSWVVMHRMHHAYSDTERDPHSPAHVGFFRVLPAQARSYEKVVGRLKTRDPDIQKFTVGLDFDVYWLHQSLLWMLPYVVHAAIAVSVGLLFGMWWLGIAYFVGIMSHPIQGWIVNAFGHAVGSRNFDTNDGSRNSHWVAWIVFGEGLQNNHHAYPSSAKFSYHKWELDPGYRIARFMDKLGWLEIHRTSLIPSPRRRASTNEIVAYKG
jgi:stearoyl-CoA desaturase (delta-9 desaturase)